MTEPAEKLELPKPEEESSDNGSMSLTEHLAELRSRIIKSLLAIALGSCAAYFFLDGITKFLTAPVGKLYFMQPGEAFFAYLKIDIVAGFLIALPVIFFHAWQFLLPALTKGERAVLGILVPASVILFFAGLAFAFFLILPIALKFFMGFNTPELESLFSFQKYLDFVLAFVLPFGFVFELPLVVIVLAQLGMLTSAFLEKYRHIIFFASFIIGALITPPDVISQISLALPIILLYEIGYRIVKHVLRK